MKTYFTSDLHFGHANVIKYCNRPYSSVDEMNEMLVVNWNSVINPEDIVYVLGDFSLSFTAVEKFTKRLNGHKFLIHGNHDHTHPAHKKSKKPENQSKWAEAYLMNGWEDVKDFRIITLEGIGDVRMVHLPYRGDDTDDRHHRYRVEDDGMILLCGHVHEKWLTKITPKGTLMLNVGVDQWNMRPVALEEIVKFIKENKNVQI